MPVMSQWVVSALGKPPRLLAGVFLAVGALFVATGLLATAYRTERRARALRHFQVGRELAGRRLLEEAVEQYRAAVSISRGNAEYRQALSLALVDMGRLSEAETHLQGLLVSDPTNAVSNLMMARILAQRGDLGQATTYYRRAVYGLWPAEAAPKRIAARLELAEFLAAHHSRKQLLGELLELLEEAPEDLDTRKHIGRLLLAAGAPDQAAILYRDLLRSHARDPDLYRELGRAEFAGGDYAAARAAYRSGLRLRPDDPELRNRAELCEQILALDPTRRRLSSSERFQRSRLLLERVQSVVRDCVTGRAEPPAEPVRKLLDDAAKLLERKVRSRDRSDASEENLSLAEELWKAREAVCAPGQKDDEALALVLARLSR